MKNELIDLAVSYKAGGIVIGSAVTSWLADTWFWLDTNMLRLSAIAAFILTIVMIFAHICTQIRQNRESKIKAVRDELEIEILRRKLKDDDQH
jgi:hypothetical protein